MSDENKKNYGLKLSQILGVELNETFYIRNTEKGYKEIFNPYKITEFGMFNSAGSPCDLEIISLLKGDSFIEKIPWKPKEGDVFFTILITFKDEITKKTWRGNTLDCLLYKSHLCFKTEEEAKENRNKIITMMQSDEVFTY